MRDFTSEMYEYLLSSLQKAGYTILTVEGFMSGECVVGPVAIIRHDIDRRVGKAEIISKVEEHHCIRSTYYFRYPSTFNPDVIRSVANHGHEIGYHYEVLSKARGRTDLARSFFMGELTRFRSIYPVKTVCMHGAPLSRYSNLDLWKDSSVEEYGLLGEAYISMQNTVYFSDTGRTWSRRNKIRDHIETGNPPGSDDIRTTSELIEYIKECRPSPLYLTTHPERWADSLIEWIGLFVLDLGINIAKRVVHGIRELSL